MKTTIISFLVAAGFGVLAEIPPVPYAPIHLALPTLSPKALELSGSTVWTSYVYQVEYQTNTANAVITETRKVTQTNVIDRAEVYVYIQPQFRESLTEDWQDIGPEVSLKLGNATNGFYTAKMRVE